MVGIKNIKTFSMIIGALDYDINIILIIYAQVHYIIKPQCSNLHIFI